MPGRMERELSRRRVLGATAAVGLLGALGGCAAGPRAEGATPVPRSLDEAIDRLVGGIDPDGPYRPPTAAERARARSATDLLLAGDAGAGGAFAELGMAVGELTDAATGRRFALAAAETGTERSWGLLVLDRTAGARLLVEAPHPVSDQHTERIGLDLLRAVPGAALVVAGAHRRAADREADVAHRTDSLFHAVAGQLSGQGFAQLQVHGFHDDSLPGQDIVISPGATREDQRTRGAADRLTAAGFRVCRAWERDCGSLEGRKNVQGVAAAKAGRPFTHLENSRSVRDDRRAALVGALAGAYRA